MNECFSTVCCIVAQRAYVAAEVQFLMDQSDTILAYENKGLDEPFGQHPLMALTSSMDRVQQLEVIYGERGEGSGEDVGSVVLQGCNHAK